MGLARGVVAAALVIGAAGCAGSSDPQAPLTQTQPSTDTTAAKPANAEPKGKLSRSEYRSIRAAFRLLAPLDKSDEVPKTLRVGNRACTKVTTQTDLLAAIHADCVQTMRFVRKAADVLTFKRECDEAAQAGDVSCWANLFRSIGRRARVAAVRSARTNAVLRKRSIRGRCAQALRTEEKQIATGMPSNAMAFVPHARLKRRTSKQSSSPRTD